MGILVFPCVTASPTIHQTMKNKKRCSRRKYVVKKKSVDSVEKPEKRKTSKRKNDQMESDPNQENLFDTFYNVCLCFAARGVWFFFFCIFITVTNMLVRGNKY